MSFPQVLTGVAHIGIPTNDLDKTIAFYKKLGFVSALETVNKAAGERVAFLQLGDRSKPMKTIVRRKRPEQSTM